MLPAQGGQMKTNVRKLVIATAVAAATALAGPAALADGRGGHHGGDHHGGSYHGGHGYYGGHYYGRHHRGEYWAWGLGLGLAAAALTWPYYRPYYYRPYYAPPAVVYSPPPVVYNPPVTVTSAPPAAPACVATREYRTTIMVDGQPVEATGLACLQQNGFWTTLRPGNPY